LTGIAIADKSAPRHRLTFQHRLQVGSFARANVNRFQPSLKNDASRM